MSKIKRREIIHYLKFGSRFDLDDIFDNNNSNDTIKIDKSWYELAYRYFKYGNFLLLYDYDTRDKNIALNDMIKVIYQNSLFRRNSFMRNLKNDYIKIDNHDLYIKLKSQFILFEENTKKLIKYVKDNNLLGLKQLIKNYSNLIIHFNITNVYDNISDILTFAILNDAPLDIIDFISKKYPTLNYGAYDRGILKAPLWIALAHNNFKLADLLIKNGANFDCYISGNNVYTYLNSYLCLNKKNLTYLINRGFYFYHDNMTNIINNLFMNNNFSSIKVLMKYYLFSNFFILDLLSIYQSKKPVSQIDLVKKINEEIKKFPFQFDFYKKALDKQNYQLIESLFNYDTRPKERALTDMIEAFDKDSKENNLKNKDTFISKIKNGKLHLNFDEYYLDNFQFIEEKKSIITKMITNNQLYQFGNYIFKNKFSLYFFNYDSDDILLLALDSNVSSDFLNYIISLKHYKSLNYTINDRSPLINALANNNFKNADILIKNGAILNSDIIYDMAKQKLINIKNLNYILNTGLIINDNLIKKLLSVLDSNYIAAILKYKAYNVNNILQLLLFSKNKIPLSSKQIVQIMGSQYNNYFSWAIYEELCDLKFDTKILRLLIKYETQSIKDLLRNYHIKRCIFQSIIRNGDYKLTEKIFSSADYNYMTINCLFYEGKRLNNKQFIKYLKFFINKFLNTTTMDFTKFKDSYYDMIYQFTCFNNIELTKFLFNKLYCHPTFNFKCVRWYKLLMYIQDFKDLDKKLYLFKYLTKKTYRNKKFTFEYIDFICCLKALKDIFNVPNSTVLKDTIKYFIDKTFANKKFNIKYMDFKNTIIELTDFGSDFIKYFIDKSFADKKFNIKYIDFKNTIIELAGFDSDFIKYFTDKVYSHPSFNFNIFHFRSFLDYIVSYITKDHTFVIDLFQKTYQHQKFNLVDVKFDDILSFLFDNSYDMEYIKKIILKSFSNKTFDYKIVNFTRCITIMNQTKNVPMIKFLFDLLFDQKSLDINYLQLSDIFYEARHSDNEDIVKYLIKRSVTHPSFNFKYFKFIDYLTNSILVKDYDVIDYFLANITMHPTFNINDIDFNHLYQMKNVKFFILDVIVDIFNSMISNSMDKNQFNTIVDWNNILLITNRYRNNDYFIKFMMDNLLSFDPFDIKTIHLEKLILEALGHHNIFTAKYLIQLVFDYDLYQDGFVDIEHLLMKANKMNNTELIQFILEQLLNIALNQDFVYIYDPFLNQCDHQFLVLILNSLIRIGHLSLIKSLVKNNNFTIDINSKDRNGDYPLMVSYYTTRYLSNGIQIFLFLLDCDANLNIKTKDNIPLFSLSLQQNSFIVTKYLLNQIKNQLKRSSTIFSPHQQNQFIMSIFGFSDLPSSTISYLLDDQDDFNPSTISPFDINHFDKYGYSLLYYATIKEDIRMINYIINHGVDIHQIQIISKWNVKINDNGYGPRSTFDIAIKMGNREILLALLDHKDFQVNQKDYNGDTLFIKIIKTKTLTHDDKYTLLRKLLMKGSNINVDVNVNVKDKKGKLAITYALEYKYIPLIDLLLQNGAKLNKLNKNKDNYNETPLKYLVRIGDIDLFKHIANHYMDIDDVKAISKLVIYRNRLDLLIVLIDKYPSLINY